MQQSDILSLAHLRLDGRRGEEQRRVRYKAGLPAGAAGLCRGADGWSYLESGLNRVLVGVQGPREGPRGVMDKGSLSISICSAPFSALDHRPKKNVDRRNQEMETNIRQTFESAVMLELYPRSCIEVTVHVLATDGSTICTIINAITLALMDAGIAMSDMVLSCSSGFVKNLACVDMTQLEQNSGICIPIAIKARSEEILFIQLDNRLSQGKLREAIENCISACRELKTLFENAIKMHIDPQDS